MIPPDDRMTADIYGKLRKFVAELRSNGAKRIYAEFTHPRGSSAIYAEFSRP